MAVVHFVHFCRGPHADQPRPGVAIRIFDGSTDHAMVGQLARAMPSNMPSTRPGPSPTREGLLAELTSRPGRTVWAWMALAPTADGPVPLGIAILVEGLGEAGPRHSIAWLIVDPAARRRGVGRQLVTQACRHAWELGAPAVYVECHSAWDEAVAFWRSVGFEPAS